MTDLRRIRRSIVVNENGDILKLDRNTCVRQNSTRLPPVLLICTVTKAENDGINNKLDSQIGTDGSGEISRGSSRVKKCPGVQTLNIQQ